MFGVQGLCVAALGLALLAASAARAGDAEKATDDHPGASGLTLNDFIAPAQFSMPKLSPSGKQLVLVRRVGEEDQILLMPVAGPDKPRAIFTAGHVTPELAKKKWRRYISYLGWKTEDTLLVSVTMPVRLDLGNESETFDEPVHMILSIDGKSAPLLLNETVHGQTARVDLSEIQNVLKDDPDHVMLTVWPQLQSIEVDRVDIHTGKREVIEHGGTDIIAYASDRKGNVVTRVIDRGGGWRTVQGRAAGETKWAKIVDIRRKELKELAKYEFLGVGDVGTVYVSANPDSPAEGDTKSVHSFDLKSMTLGPVVWSHPTYDVDDIVQDEDSGEIIGGCYWVDTYTCDFKSAKLSANLKGLNKYFNDERNLFIVSQSADDKQWVLLAEGPDNAGSYFLYDVDAHHISPLGDKYPKLTEERLAKARRFNFKTRDDVPLSAYVTEPPGPADHLRPLVVMPHGGPEVRDKYTFDILAQYLASRGYAVLQPNFRGSGGFGRKFAEAGYGQWGARMHEDVMDAAKALIAEGKVDPKRVCIVGGSYGGYEAMYSAATEPDTFKCAVSFDGVSDLVGIVKFERSYGTDSMTWAYWRRSEGDPATDSARMLAHSPYRMAANWKTPTLLIHGDKDDIVPVEESRQMKRALEAAGKPVRYVEIPGMGHGPSSDDEIIKVFSEIDTFLAAHIGDPVQPSAPVKPAR